MRKLLFILALLPSLVFSQAVINLSPDSTLHKLHILQTVSAFGAEYQAVYDAYTTKPDDATAAIWNTYVESGVADGWWAKEDVEYVYAAHTNADGEALINWINPGTFDATAFNAPAFTANEGFIGGTNQYIDWNWNPAVNGINYVKDDASYGLYVRTDHDGNIFEMGSRNAANDNASIRVRRSNEIFTSINDLGSNTLEVANTDSRGMYVVSRTASNVRSVYKNKAQSSDTENSTAIPSFNFYSLAWNNDGSAGLFSPKQLSMVYAGAGFTQTDVNNKTDAFETAMDALGKGVIP